MVTKKELKTQLYELNIPVYGSCKIKKSDIENAFRINAKSPIYLHCTTPQNAKKILKDGFEKKIDFFNLDETDLNYGTDRMLSALEKIPKHRKFVKRFEDEEGEEDDEMLDEFIDRLHEEFGKRPHTLIWVAENEAWNSKGGAVLQLKSIPKGSFPMFENFQGIGLYVPLASIPSTYFKLFDLKQLNPDGTVKKALSHYECTAGVIPLDFIKKVINTLKKKLISGTKLDLESLNNFIKEKTSGDLMAFARDALKYFKEGKLRWTNEFGLLQEEYKPGGYDIIPWSFLKRQLSDLKPEVEQQLPRAFVQKLSTQ